MKLEYYKSFIDNREELQSTVLELKQLEDIVDFTVRKEKMTLPRRNNTNKGKFVCFLNTSKQGIANILNNEHSLILNQSSAYKGYYYDHISLRLSIKTQRIKNPGFTKSELKAQRLTDYGEIQELSSIIMTPVNIASLNKKNFVYDLEPFTRLIKSQEKLKKIPLIERLKIYFRSIGNLYNNINKIRKKRG